MDPLDAGTDVAACAASTAIYAVSKQAHPLALAEKKDSDIVDHLRRKDRDIMDHLQRKDSDIVDHLRRKDSDVVDHLRRKDMELVSAAAGSITLDPRIDLGIAGQVVTNEMRGT
ncbi:hypothetical protein M407DRAFT_28142 [Tulasnella calospora MUT 4182]|uniref:Uncharacterized protein n=1 Tax=Tulasnella calospora MUT 4182 TaxID=1051891 RepID=A0A0C3KLY8_9AGAM|nr:hypothetical protein M407DRAFT_28142 [Tulasnella calospora MUT 4182]